MKIGAPPILTTTAAEITARLVGTAGKHGLLERYTTAAENQEQQYGFKPWREYDPVAMDPVGQSAALIGVFARMCEVLIERLNRVPDKNFVAFLNLLGAARQPPQPSRVPLTFTLAAGATGDALVPRGTQAAAPPPAGESNPVVFETERPLVVTAARLTSLLTLDPDQDSYGDWSDRLAAVSTFAVFQGERQLDHVLYIGDPLLLGFTAIADLRINVELAESVPVDAEDRDLQWEHWDGAQWRRLQPLTDSTNGLRQAGTVRLGPVAAIMETPVASRSSRWLRCRLMTPVTQSSVRRTGMVRQTKLSRIRQIELKVRDERPAAGGLVPDLGFLNATPLDVSKGFYPLGENPKQYDCMYLANAEVFSRDRSFSGDGLSAQVSLHVQLAPDGARASDDLELSWECWTGASWQEIGTSKPSEQHNALKLSPVPMLSTEDGVTSAVLEGTAPPGMQVISLASVSSDGASSRRLPIGNAGAFAERRVLSSGINIFQFNGTDKRGSRTAWIAIFNGEPTITLEVDVPRACVDASSFALPVSIIGTDRERASRIRVTSGRSGAKVYAASGDTVTVPLAEGRNDFLVEALAVDEKEGILAATTATISRRVADPPPDANGFVDGTLAFGQSGTVTFRLPDSVAKTSVNGQDNYWLRVVLAKGGYGKEARYVLKDPANPGAGFVLVPASFVPPQITSLGIGYVLEARRKPPLILTHNQIGLADRAGALTFTPFAAATESERPGLYFGFVLPNGRAFPNTTISLYSRSPQSRYGERTAALLPATSLRVGTVGTTVVHIFSITNTTDHYQTFRVVVLGHQWPAIEMQPEVIAVDPGATGKFTLTVSIPDGAQSGESDAGFVRIVSLDDPDRIESAVFATSVDALPDSVQPEVGWQYWNGKQWIRLAVSDGSRKFMRSGLIEFLAPADLAPRELFGRERYWLRAELEKGKYAVQPRLSGILPNTTIAVQATTVVNELLGSSNGTERQTFRSRQVPVLAGQRLEVREPVMPAAEDRVVLEREGGADAIDVVVSGNRSAEIWVRWHEVPDFYASGTRDRHYVMDHLSGVIEFGDGIRGQIPPIGTGNVRLARYQAGGGTRGNCPPATVTVLKTTVPYVDSVGNLEPADGGAEAETLEALIERTPRTLRHRERAVTLEDYEDLVRASSPEVARSLCVPLRDLAGDPLNNKLRPGAVSIIVVPRSGDNKPVPSLDLLERVRNFLAVRADATASVSVVGPLYIRVSVELDVAVTAKADAKVVERATQEKLAAFLHPLTGGLDGNGWDFGREPHRSDLIALVDSVPEVDHVRYLSIVETEDQPGVRRTGRFLVFSGRHQINMTLLES